MSWHRIKYYFIDLKRNIMGFFHRGKHGYAKHDLWNFDHYLAGMLGKGIKELAEKSNGWPAQYKEFPTFEDYQNMLLKMASGFTNYHENTFENYDNEEEDQRMRDNLSESLELFKKYFGTLWD